MQVTSSSLTGYSREENGYQGVMDAPAPRWSPRIIYIRAGVMQLASPLIPFAVFKDNPLLSFHAAREARRSRKLRFATPCILVLVDCRVNPVFFFFGTVPGNLSPVQTDRVR